MAMDIGSNRRMRITKSGNPTKTEKKKEHTFPINFNRNELGLSFNPIMKLHRQQKSSKLQMNMEISEQDYGKMRFFPQIC